MTGRGFRKGCARKGCARILCAFLAALCLCSCPVRQTQAKLKPREAPSSGAESGATSSEPKGPDPRAAFESSGIVDGLTARLQSPVILIAASGLPETGVALALGASLSTAAIARRSAQNGARVAKASASELSRHELILSSGARASLPGPALALAASGERIVASCADSSSVSGGTLICFNAGGEGERLVLDWQKACQPASRLVAVPGGRIAVCEESSQSPRLYLLDLASGSELWAQPLSAVAVDIAYAPGLVLAASGPKLVAFDESTGSQAWGASLTASACSLSAGNGVALVLAASGSLTAFSLEDGKGLGAAPGPFDSAVRPVADGSRALVADLGGGAEEIEVKTGQSLRRWSWNGSASFLAADSERLYAGLSSGGIVTAPRSGEGGPKFLSLSSGAFDAPIAVGGSRGGLLVPLLDASLVLVGKELESGSQTSALEAAIAPAPETASAIMSALGRFKPSDGVSPGRYLGFDVFVQGRPVEPGMAFMAFRYDPASSAKTRFTAVPAKGGTIVSIYDEAGHELASSIDELGSVSSAAAYLEKGKRYWVGAGWSYQAEPETFRIFAR